MGRGAVPTDAKVDCFGVQPAIVIAMPPSVNPDATRNARRVWCACQGLVVICLLMKASPSDIDVICRSLPEVELGVSWGDRPTYKVPRGPKGKGFLLYRAPGKTAMDPITGEMFNDLLVISVPSEEAKNALVHDPSSPFFTIDHFNGYNAVLVQQSRLCEIERDFLTEILTEAWASKAPKALVKEYFHESE